MSRYNEYGQDKDNFLKVFFGVGLFALIVMATTSGIVPLIIASIAALSLQAKLFSLAAVALLSYLGLRVLRDPYSVGADAPGFFVVLSWTFYALGWGSALTLVGYLVWRLFGLL
jgi:hypothetical protein